MIRKNSKQKQIAFTLIELLIVIAIIALLSSIVLIAVSNARIKARDTKRKTDLQQIAKALELYAAKHGSYPQTCWVTNPCVPPVCGWCSADRSTDATWLQSLVADGDINQAPLDPLNNSANPGLMCYALLNPANPPYNYMYTYASDGKGYILCGWLENHNDPDRLELHDVWDPWAYNGIYKLYANEGYSPYNYVLRSQ